MNLDEFMSSLTAKAPPKELNASLRALWFDHNGDWDEAHAMIQDNSDILSAAIHAYLHRKEGDTWNANYWYRNAQRTPWIGSLEDEWMALAQEATTFTT